VSSARCDAVCRIVRRSRRRGQRIPLQQRTRHRIHAGQGDGIADKRGASRADGHGRIVDDRHASGDRFGEDSLSLQQRRDRGGHRAADRLALPLVVHEEKRAVFHHRSAERATELIPSVLRFDGTRRLKEIPCVQHVVAQELEPNAMNRVGAGFGREIHDAAIESAELGGRTIALDLELLNRVDHRKKCHLPRLRLQHRDAVVEVFVRARTATIDPGKLRVGRQCDARSERRQRHERAAVQRQLDHLLVLHHGSKARRLRPQDRRVRRHRDLFADVPDGELEVDAGLFARGQMNPLTPDRPETRELHIDAVVTRRQTRRGVHAVAARRHDALPVRGDVGHRHGRARHGRPGLILHDPGDFAAGHLRPERRGTGGETARRDNQPTNDTHDDRSH
jgi:hypothetical protein